MRNLGQPLILRVLSTVITKTTELAAVERSSCWRRYPRAS